MWSGNATPLPLYDKGIQVSGGGFPFKKNKLKNGRLKGFRKTDQMVEIFIYTPRL